MATVYKDAQVQANGAIGTYSTLYNTGASTTAVLSTIAVCNTASTAATYRIGLMGSAGSPSASEWIVNGATVQPNDTVFITAGITLGNTKFIRVSADASTVTFSAFISEIS